MAWENNGVKAVVNHLKSEDIKIVLSNLACSNSIYYLDKKHKKGEKLNVYSDCSLPYLFFNMDDI